MEKTQKVRWGVLGAAKIALEKVIPAMQQGAMSDVELERRLTAFLGTEDRSGQVTHYTSPVGRRAVQKPTAGR